MPVFLLAMAVALADQITKEWVVRSFAYHETRTVIPGFFNLTHVRNPGAAWGILGGQSVLLTVLSAVILAVLVIGRKRILSDTRTHRLALGVMAGGILGNLFDRLRYGWVVDFLDFYVGRWHWPAFNVADAAICIGVGIYLLTSFQKQDDPSGSAAPETRG